MVVLGGWGGEKKNPHPLVPRRYCWHSPIGEPGTSFNNAYNSNRLVRHLVNKQKNNVQVKKKQTQKVQLNSLNSEKFVRTVIRKVLHSFN